MNKFYYLYIIVLLIVCQLWSQETTGNLEGWIFSSDKSALSDVQIIVSGSSLQGTRGAVSTANGHFRIVNLPVGSYRVVIEHVAFHPLTIEKLKISLGKTTTLGQVELASKTFEVAEVVIESEQAIIDPSSTTSGLNLGYDEIDPLPVSRDYKSLAALTPHANTSYYGDEVNISGSTSQENGYYVDGVLVSDPLNGFSGTNLPYNFVKEVQVKTGGYEAEYGTALGGVISVITHSGSNRFSGKVFGFFTNNRFGGERTTSVVGNSVETFRSYDVGIALSGPIAADKLWYFLAYNPNTHAEDISLDGLGDFQDKSVKHMFSGKLNWQASERTHVVLTVFGDPEKRDGVLSWGNENSTIVNKDVLLTNVTGGGLNVAMHARSMVTNNFLVEANVARIQRKLRQEGATERGRTEPLFVDLQTSTYSGGVPNEFDNNSVRITSTLKASYFLSKHTLKAGIEFEDVSLLSTSLETPDAQTAHTAQGLNWVLRVHDSLYFASAGQGDDTRVRNRIPAFFLQDHWQITPRLLINLGLRWSNEYLIGSDGRVAQRIKNEFQPRMGIVFQPGQLGSQKIFGFYGRFYEKLPPQFVSFFYAESEGYSIRFDHNPLEDVSGGDTLSFSSGIYPELPGMGGQYTDEFSLGYERRVGRKMNFTVQGTYRYLGEVVEDAYDPELGQYVVGNLGKGNMSFMPRARREYLGLQLSLQRFSSTGLNFMASYTLSRTYGNYGGLFNQDFGGNWANASGIFDIVEQIPNSTGLLANDRPHVFKLWGAYRLPFGLNIGSSFIWQSGTPLNEFGSTDFGFSYVNFLKKRGTVGRTPSLWDLSVRLSYKLLQLTNISSKLILDLLHLGNPRRATRLDQRRYFAVDENGNQIQENSRYLQPRSLQAPMTIRMGMEVEF
ncbi:MAG: TonB-dependent receptor [Calditrichaeota bacterium]|nr:MAG: TonB-dependent receptor [Calditrichota bacterium]